MLQEKELILVSPENDFSYHHLKLSITLHGSRVQLHYFLLCSEQGVPKPPYPDVCMRERKSEKIHSQILWLLLRRKNPPQSPMMSTLMPFWGRIKNQGPLAGEGQSKEK